MSYLVTSDIHLTEKPQDAHRWGLFEWLKKQAKKEQARAVFLLGDMTEAKDRHSSSLVNRLVRELVGVAEQAEVIILRGNHDYVDEDEPFFNFANDLRSVRLIKFLTKPAFLGKEVVCLPNTRNYKEAWGNEVLERAMAADLVFCHQTFDGALSETGFRLDGIPPSLFAKSRGRVWSGDVHKPQTVSRKIEYVGSPYRVRFGDDFDPRVVLLEGGKSKDLRFPTKNKVVVDIQNPSSAKEACRNLTMKTAGECYAGDQVKVRVHLRRSAFPEWPEIKRRLVKQAREENLELTGPELVPFEAGKQAKAGEGPGSVAGAPGTVKGGASALQAMQAYAKAKGLPAPLVRAGESLLKQAEGENQ